MRPARKGMAMGVGVALLSLYTLAPETHRNQEALVTPALGHSWRPAGFWLEGASGLRRRQFLIVRLEPGLSWHLGFGIAADLGDPAPQSSSLKFLNPPKAIMPEASYSNSLRISRVTWHPLFTVLGSDSTTTQVNACHTKVVS